MNVPKNHSLITWLLDPENPPIRYRALVELLERPAAEIEIVQAYRAISGWLPIARLLALQKKDGYWVQRDYYIPKHTSTFWVLSLLTDLGLTKEDDHIRRGCDFLFAHQWEDGQFHRRRKFFGRGIDWEERAEPCTQARIIRLLIQAGYGDDPRTRAAIRWMLETQRKDAMWLCGHAHGKGCLRATLDFLQAAVLDSDTAALLETTRAAQVVCSLLMERNMGRYHVEAAWEVLIYPYYGYSIISALNTLAKLGYPLENPHVRMAVDYLLSRRLPDGRWPLDIYPSRTPMDFGKPGEPNKWLTLDAILALKDLESVQTCKQSNVLT